MSNLAILPLAALAMGVLLQLLLGRLLSPVAKGRLALACGLVALGATLALVPAVAGGARPGGALFAWDRGIALNYHIDGLSVVFMLLGTAIGSAILLYCIPYMAHEPEGITRFYALMLAFIGGLVNLVMSANLLMAYVSWEIIGLCSYFLVGFWYRQQPATDGARKVLIMTHLPGYGLLLGILLLHTRTGSFLWTDPAMAGAFTGGVFVLMLLAAMAKSVIFPLHTWIPEAMNAPTPVSALLHSACYVKAGVYLIARMYSFTAPGLAAAGVSPLAGSGAAGVHWPAAWSTLVLALGCLTMLAGALFALAQTDLKRLLAFSTVSQLGHIITALGLGTALGVGAALFYCLSHGLFKGTLFLCAGSVQHATGTRDLRRLGGLAGRMPNTTAAWLIAAAAIVGVPLSNGFVAKWLLYDAALGAGAAVVVAAAWLASIFTAFYMLKATATVFYGEMPAALRERPPHEAPPAMQAGMGILAALCVIFGIFPQALMRWVVAPAVGALGFTWTVNLSFLGFQSGANGLQVTAGALVTVTALLAGWAAYSIAESSRQAARAGQMGGAGLAMVPVFTGGDPLPIGDTVTALDFADIAQVALTPVYAAGDPDPVYLAGWRAIRGAAGWFGQALLPAAERPVATSLILVAVVIVFALVTGV